MVLDHPDEFLRKVVDAMEVLEMKARK